MATNTTQTPFNSFEQTEFQLHKSQIAEFSQIQGKVIDFTEKKLITYMKTVIDKQQKLILHVMLADYIGGHVAISWKRGKPTYVRVKKTR